MRNLWPIWCTCAAAAAFQARAQDTAAQPQQVVVTGSIAERRVQDVPFAISVVDGDTLRSSGPMVNLSESMARVPGLVVANRNNYAQDLQISSRGFGARAGFGVRGLRLYTDGIPASMPDGQGQVSHFALSSAERIEVLRGPFSVLYGNSSGGVIAVVSAPARQGRLELGYDGGSFGLSQWRAQVASPLGGGFDLRVDASTLEWDGFRPHASARKDAGQVRLGWQGERDSVVVLASGLDQPAEDPLGLTRAQFDADARQTTPEATQFNTRKTLNQTQAGMRWSHRFDGLGPLAQSALVVYGGRRSVVQWLAINANTQAPARHGGGVIDFTRNYRGVDGRLTWRWEGVDLVTGLASERQGDDRRGFLNYTGPQAAPVYGGVGTLRRSEVNRAASDDAYAQLEWQLANDVALIGGVRGGRVVLNAQDRFLNNGDDSGERRFRYTNPVFGARWRAAPSLTLHASVARGFESPTLGELAYRRDSTGGFNTTLEPQKSRQAEIGAKWRAGEWQADAALFEVRTDDEIGVATNAGGRQSFQNVGRTLRRGGELSLAWRFAPQWRAQAAATLLDATYRDGFLACAGIPCNAPTVPVAAGNRIAGTQRGTAFAEVAWQPRAGTDVGLELRAASALTANDSNTEAAPRYALLALRASHRYTLPDGFALDLLARIDNLTDKTYAGSVIVNDANGRFYEPGAPRSAWLGLRLSRGF